MLGFWTLVHWTSTQSPDRSSSLVLTVRVASGAVVGAVVGVGAGVDVDPIGDTSTESSLCWLKYPTFVDRNTSIFCCFYIIYT